MTDAATTSDLMCDNTFSYSNSLPSTSSYDDSYGVSSSMNDIVGFAMDNVMIANAVTSSS